ncbi:hypothetical protein M3M33_16725, partial [Loigolactobacillus coryniformis]|uniref:hypothetical protein n=1 Tax=Loigolactobacillus coryniformis TaxID=1610 RepID=UPI00201AB005
SFFVGDSGSGKTFLTLTQFAEAARNPDYDDYEFYYLDGENGAFFEFKRYFGKKADARIQTIPVTHTEEVYDFLEKKGNE